MCVCVCVLCIDLLNHVWLCSDIHSSLVGEWVTSLLLQNDKPFCSDICVHAYVLKRLQACDVCLMTKERLSGLKQMFNALHLGFILRMKSDTFGSF